MKNRLKRRTFIINKDFQGKYIFSYFIIVGAGLLLFTILFSIFSSDTLSIIYDNHNLRLGTTPVILLNKILGTLWIFIVVGGILVVIYSTFMSHRIAGPQYRFEKSLEEMINGNLDIDINLRKKDEGKKIAEQLNQFNNSLSSKLKVMTLLSNEIDNGIRLLSEKNNKNEPIVQDLEQLSTLNDRLNELLSSFKTKS